MQISRRAALGLAAVAVAGCQSKSKSSPSPTATSPDAAALETARRFEQTLLAAYDARIRRTPLHRRGALQVERAIHAAHLAALHGSPTRPPATARPAAIPTVLRSSASTLRRLAFQAADGANAALLASIAASHTVSGQ